MNDDIEKRSVRGSLSIFNSPNNFPNINASGSGRINESQLSILSHSNLNMLDNLNNMRKIQDFLLYDGDRNLDVSVSSVCSTPRNPTLIHNDDSRFDVYSGFRGNSSIPASPSSSQF